MKIAMVNTEKNRGGAAYVANTLCEAFNDSGSAVNATLYHSGDTCKSDNFRGFKQPGARQINAFGVRMGLADSHVLMDVSKKIKLAIEHCDVLHLHNLHGYYLDYRNLISDWSERPIVWTWHDMWGATGRCGFSIDCNGWQSGCNPCVFKSRYPATWVDRANQTYVDRFEFFQSMKLLKIVCPSQWLADIAIARGYPADSVSVISNPVDTAKYEIADQTIARNTLGVERHKR